jgi:phage-related tail fiber protein
MSAKFLNGIQVNNKQITNLADGSAATDAVTLQQLQAMVRGLDWKASVRVASTANISIASPGASINGVTMAAGDRFLAKDQTAGAENGIYVWNAAASPATRAADADVSAEVSSGMAVTATEGTVNGDTVWVLTTNDPITLGTTALVFAQLGGGSTPYTAGAGMTLTGADFNVIGGTGITVNADNIQIDTSVVARKFAANCVATTNPQTFAHGLGTADLDVTVRESAVKVYPDISIDATNITVDWGAAPTAAQYRVIAVG